MSAQQNGWLSRLRSKGDKTKEKKAGKKKSKKDGDNSSNDANDGSLDGNSDQNSGEVKVDDEGYIIRPSEPSKRETDDFYSSDSDDSDNEGPVNKIHVVIKPIVSSSNGTSNMSDFSNITVPSPFQPPPSRAHVRRQISTGSGSSSSTNSIKKSTSEVLHHTNSGGILKPILRPNTNNILGGFMSISPNTFGSNGSTSSSNGNSTISKTASDDRYAALSSLFEESSIDSTTSVPFSTSFSFSSSKPLSLSKSVSSLATAIEPISALPRPISKRSQFQTLSQQSSLSRAESYGSLSSTDFRMTPLSFGSSRGSSPLTRGLSDTIPIAVAFQESISARFKGSDETRCQSQVFGSVKFAFPSNIIQALANNIAPSIFAFRLRNSAKIHKLQVNKDFVSIADEETDDNRSFTIDVISLGNHLQKLLVQNPKARYYNVDILKYQLKTLGAKSCPLQVVSHWKCETQSTFLKIEYKYNPGALSSMKSIKNATFNVNVRAQVTGAQGKPQPLWNSSTKQACWKIDNISHNTNDNGLGSLRAKFDIIEGPSVPMPVIVQFSCEDTSLSGIEFELSSLGYRVTMLKKTITTGRYTCEADSNIDYACI